MTLLLGDAEWRDRAELARGPFATTVDALAAPLARLAAAGVAIPREKALLSREGGRCPRDGTLLEYDPWDPHRHRCATCNEVVEGDAHDRFRLYWHHLWLAERALHAAILWRLGGDAAHLALASSLLDGYADAYAGFPNVDNALGPSRVFFSTYLESIWLLQLVLALDTLESGGATGRMGATLRGQLVEPSVALIASFDEGGSNRQVWNDAAMLAAGLLLDRGELVDRAVHGPSGITKQLGTGLLPDGTWYEGENYHLFAHRGLWYGVTLAARAGIAIDPALLARFDRGFIAPFLTTFPDLTLPSRRDSQYAISVRQPRFAELCELGRARHADRALDGILAQLYEPDIPRRASLADRTSADVERNGPATAVTRADLGWRALLFARPELPAAGAARPLPSVLLRDQGIATFRRAGTRVVAALDYGHSGGGHGHPDRLNLLLGVGAHRWLDDMGTGSYVERALHWYRSTLAHDAPLANGHSQPPTDGRLLAHDERGAAGWIRAEARIAAGVVAQRTLVVLDGYLVDELRWHADAEAVVDLPIHLDATIVSGAGELTPCTAEDITPRAAGDPPGLEDGFDFISEVSRARVPEGAITRLRTTGAGAASLESWVMVDGEATWWRATAPGASGIGPVPFHVVRTRGREGRVRTVHAWEGSVIEARFDPDAIALEAADGTRHRHAPTNDGWRVELFAGAAHSSIDLGGVREALRTEAGHRAPDIESSAPGAASPRQPATAVPVDGLEFALGEPHYRRSEPTWEEAGRPTARVHLLPTPAGIQLTIQVRKPHGLVVHDAGTTNPLDNEPADVNADGVQLYLSHEGRTGGWRLPLRAGGRVDPAQVAGWGALPLRDSQWREVPGGYELSVMVPIPPASARELRLDLLVNDVIPSRSRRRGQLVMSGATGEWAYLRGDRHDPARLLSFVLPR